MMDTEPPTAGAVSNVLPLPEPPTVDVSNPPIIPLDPYSVPTTNISKSEECLSSDLPARLYKEETELSQTNEIIAEVCKH